MAVPISLSIGVHLFYTRQNKTEYNISRKKEELKLTELLQQVKEHPVEIKQSCFSNIISNCAFVPPFLKPLSLFSAATEVGRSFAAGILKGRKEMEFLLNPLQEPDKNHHFQDSSFMLYCLAPFALLYSAVYGLRAFVKGFISKSASTKTKNASPPQEIISNHFVEKNKPIEEQEASFKNTENDTDTKNTDDKKNSGLENDETKNGLPSTPQQIISNLSKNSPTPRTQEKPIFNVSFKNINPQISDKNTKNTTKQVSNPSFFAPTLIEYQRPIPNLGPPVDKDQLERKIEPPKNPVKNTSATAEATKPTEEIKNPTSISFIDLEINVQNANEAKNEEVRTPLLRRALSESSFLTSLSHTPPDEDPNKNSDNAKQDPVEEEIDEANMIAQRFSVGHKPPNSSPRGGESTPYFQ